MISRGIAQHGLAAPLTLFLLLLSTSGVAWGLSSITKDIGLPYLLLFSSTGALAGWLLRFWKIRLGRVILFTLTSSLILFLLHYSSTITALTDAIYTLYSFLSSSIDEPSFLLENLAPLIRKYKDFGHAFIEPFIDLSGWINSLAEGEVVYDSRITHVFWTGTVWLTALWAGYCIKARINPLIALTPCGLLLAGSLNYVDGDASPILLFTGAALCLIPLLNYKKREQIWIDNRTDYAEDLALDTNMVALPIIAFFLLLGTFIPVIRIKPILQIGQDIYQMYAEKVKSAGDLLGLEIKPEMHSDFSSLQSPGLPREHLLGTGPELNEQIVMTIEVDDPSATILINQMNLKLRYYWRGVTYDRYTGRGWETSQLEKSNYKGGESLFEDVPTRAQGARTVVHKVQRIQSTSRLVYAAGTIIEVDQDYQIYWRITGDDNFEIYAGFLEADRFRVQSLLIQYGDEQLRSAEGEIPAWVTERYLQLPATLPERVHILAQEITGSITTPYEKAQAIEAYLRQFEYSLDVNMPPPDRDVADYFLFELGRGYCDYYATAMVVLARSIGIPARLVTGYTSGRYDNENDYYLVTEADAHSWPELYLPGVGWVEFEPTGGLPVPERPDWNAAGVDFQELDPAKKFNLLEYINSITNQEIFRWLVITAPFIAGFFIWLFGELIVIRLLPASKSIRYAFQRLYRQAATLTQPNYPGDTPNEFSERLQTRLQNISGDYWLWNFLRKDPDDLDNLTYLYNLTLYSSQSASEVEKRRASRLRWHLRWQISFARLKDNLTNMIFFVIIGRKRKNDTNQEMGNG